MTIYCKRRLYMVKKIFLQLIRSSLAQESTPVITTLSKEQWNEIFILAKNHRLIPLLLNSIYQSYPFDKTDLDPLKAHTKLLVYEQTLKTQNFLEVYSHLLSKGLEPVVVKGIVCRSYYPDPDCRTSSDEDILIPAKNFDLYCCALEEISSNPIKEEAKLKYQTTFLRSGKFPLEIHKSLFPTDSDYFLRWNNLFANVFETTAHINIQNCSIRTLCPTDHLLYLTLHSLKHFIHSGVGIRQVCDITLMANTYGKELDWQKYFDACKSLSAEYFALALFAIGEKHLTFDRIAAGFPSNIDLTAIDEIPLLEDIIDAGVFGSSTMSRRHSAGFTFETAQGKKTNVLKRAFPSRKSISNKYHYAKKNPILLPIAWAHRLANYKKEIKNNPDNRPSVSLQTGRERLELLKIYNLVNHK